MAQVAIVAIVAMFLAFLYAGFGGGSQIGAISNQVVVRSHQPAPEVVLPLFAVPLPPKDHSRLVTDMPLPERKPNGYK